MKKIFSLVLVFLMIMTILPLTAMADTIDRAQITDSEGTTTKYSTLQAAINACPDGTKTTIVMIEDEVLSQPVTVPANKNIVINLNEHTVGYTVPSLFSLDFLLSGNGHALSNKGTLTVKNGTISVNSSGNAVVGVLNESGSLTLECNVVASTSYSGASAYAVRAGGVSASTTTINKGTYTATASGNQGSATVLYVNNLSDFIINGGTFNANGNATSRVIYTLATGEITVNAGSFNASGASTNTALLSAGTMAPVLRGGVYTGSITVGTAFNAQKPTITGGVYSQNVSSYVDSSKGYEVVQISGGKYIVGKSIKLDDDAKLTGGNFTFDATDFCANGYACVKNDDGSWDVDTSFNRIIDDVTGGLGNIGTIFQKLLKTITGLLSTFINYITGIFVR